MLATMSALICSNCGGITNTAVCCYRVVDHFVFKCYARVENGIWTKGCGFNDPDCDQWIKPSIENLIGTAAVVNTDLRDFDFDKYGKDDEED